MLEAIAPFSYTDNFQAAAATCHSSSTTTVMEKVEKQWPGLIVICGPTASGKTGLAIALAQRLNTVILSADSRQVYREFNIGTAKPTPAEQQQIPHHFIDICEPTETLTVANYQTQAQALISHLQKRGKTPLLVGGTGLYIKAIVNGLKIPQVPPHPELRSHLSTLGQFQCYQHLGQVDPIAAQRIHPNDTIRTLRALEVFYVTGKPISQQQGENPPPYPIRHIGLDCPQPHTLTHRIEQRTTQMIERGFVQEVANLVKKYGPDLPLLQTLGYQEIQQYLDGSLTLSQARDLTILHTRQFAKRQRTWFRQVSEIAWFDADAPDVLDQVWATLPSQIQT